VAPSVKTKPKFDPASPKLKAIESELEALVPKGVRVPAPAMPKPRAVELMRAFRDFANGAARFAELNRIFPSFAEALEALLKEFKRDPRMFGCRTVEEMRDRIFHYLSEFGISAETKAEFLAKSAGYKSNLNGEVNEWLIRNDVELNLDVHAWSRSETAELNRVVEATAGRSPADLSKMARRIVDANGNPVTLAEKVIFGEPVRVSDVVIDPPKGSPKKFVDDMEATFPLGVGGQPLLDASGNPSFMSPPVMGQFKFRTAIRKAAGQLAEDPARMADMRQLRFKFRGKEYTFTRDKVLFVAENGEPNLNVYVVANSDLLAHPGTPRPAYASSIDELLGAERPQVTPFSKLVTRPGRDVRVRGVLVELAVGSKLVQSISDLVFKP
jgi:hypothetical protein